MKRMLNYASSYSGLDRYGDYTRFRSEALELAKSAPGSVIVVGSNRWSEVGELACTECTIPEASLMISHSDAATLTDMLVLLARIRAQFRMLETAIVHGGGPEQQELYAKMTAMFTVTGCIDITSIRQSGFDESPR